MEKITIVKKKFSAFLIFKVFGFLDIYMYLHSRFISQKSIYQLHSLRFLIKSNEKFLHVPLAVDGT